VNRISLRKKGAAAVRVPISRPRPSHQRRNTVHVDIHQYARPHPLVEELGRRSLLPPPLVGAYHDKVAALEYATSLEGTRSYLPGARPIARPIVHGQG
jgi:hypothetical protein